MLALLALLALAPGRTWTVRPGTALPTLTAALARAQDGDTILVADGEYREPEIVVTRKVLIRGTGAAIFHGGDHQVLTILADSVTLRGLVIRDMIPVSSEDRAAIRVTGSRGCVIEHNTLLGTFFGVYLSKTTGCVVRDNRIVGTGSREALSGNAIHSWTSDSLTVTGNTLSGHRDGIYFEFTSHARVTGNTSDRNLRYGLHFMFSDDCTYRGNRFGANRAGTAVMYSRRVTMAANSFERSTGNASYGLILKELTDSRLTGNSFAANTAALYLEGTTRVTVDSNRFRDNGWAVQVMADAQETSFAGNRFEGNSFDVSTNSINASSRFEGNYWDRYRGYDLDRDGRGDVPFAPVRLFALIVQQNPPTLILLRSFFVSVLDAAERVAPVLTPATMIDHHPLMRPPALEPTS